MRVADSRMRDKGKDKLNTDLNTKLINTQGLTTSKLVKIEKLVDSADFVCITETQSKFNRFGITKGICKVENFRNMKERKAGGIMLLSREENKQHIEIIAI